MYARSVWLHTAQYKILHKVKIFLPSSLNEQHGDHANKMLLQQFGKSVNRFLSLCELSQLLNNVYEDLHQQHYQERGQIIIYSISKWHKVQKIFNSKTVLKKFHNSSLLNKIKNTPSDCVKVAQNLLFTRETS